MTPAPRPNQNGYGYKAGRLKNTAKKYDAFKKRRREAKQWATLLLT